MSHSFHSSKKSFSMRREKKDLGNFKKQHDNQEFRPKPKIEKALTPEERSKIIRKSVTELEDVAGIKRDK